MSRRSIVPFVLRGSRLDDALLAFLAAEAVAAFAFLFYVFTEVGVWVP